MLTGTCPKCGDSYIMKTSTQKTCSKRECRTGNSKPKAISPIGARTKERIKENGTENDFFIKEVWDKREHKCEICFEQIFEPAPWCFSHRLGKGRYPALRYMAANITLVCSEECHHANDARNKGMDLYIIQEIMCSKEN